MFETTGKRRFIEDALHFTGEGRKLVLMSLRQPSGFDVTPLWFKNINLMGTVFSGTESHNGEITSSFDIALEAASQKGLPSQELITHQFTLEDYSAAFATVEDRGANKAVKVIFHHVL
ncbi:hypothetical protein ACFL2Q_04920 [Thermodesulfobacteriota bacterium]